MTAWEKTTLGSVAALVSSKVPASSITLENYVSTENMLPDFGGVVDSPSLPSLEKFNSYCQSDTLFSNIRTYFKKVWFANKNGGASADVLVFRTQDPVKLDPRFLNYVLSSQKFIDFSDLTAKGAKMPRGDKSAMLGFEFNLPPIQTQRAIAQVLGALDDKIALNRRMNATLEAMARALFKDWFVDFGPVRAKIAGSAPTLAPEIWDLFPSAIGADGLPVGWEIKPFNALMASNLGGDWGKESVDEEFNKPVCIIRGTDIPELNAGTRGKVPTRYTTHKKAESRLLAEGDIVIEVSGGSPTQPTGRSLLITNEILNRFNNPMVCASFCRRFRPNSFQAGVFAAQHLALLYAEGGTWEYQNQSTGIANFQTTHFLETEKIIDPGATVLKAFLALVEPMIRQIATNESIELANLRDTLLPRLLSGELKMGDILLN